ncbi:MAG TPA: DUF6011 domain-containing protein [Egibacteraceae bacterium]|nr:DUF6011 domain-containing protein [Egibacteraceae bacterium]
MGLARKLQPGSAGGLHPVATRPVDLLERGIDQGWQRAQGMVALLSWDDLSQALTSQRAGLIDAWLTLTSVGNGAHLLVVRAALLATTRRPDDRRLHPAGFQPGERPGEWFRPVGPHDLDVIVRVLKGPLEVAHPQVLRFSLLAADASPLRLLFGPLREQARRPVAAGPHTQTCPAGSTPSGPPCRGCGQPLEDPESVARGYGSVCWKALVGGSSTGAGPR